MAPVHTVSGGSNNRLNNIRNLNQPRSNPGQSQAAAAEGPIWNRGGGRGKTLAELAAEP